MRERDRITLRRLASSVAWVGWFVRFLGLGIIVALKKVLEVLKRLGIKVVLTMTQIVLDMIRGKSIEKNDLGFVVVEFFLVTSIQQFSCTKRFLEAGVK